LGDMEGVEMKPTKEEMLNWLMAVERDLFRTDEGWTKTDKRLCGAIRDLIEKVGECAKEAHEIIREDGKFDNEGWPPAEKLLREIRDFGKEGL